MIQRIQTVYLLIVTILMVFMMSLPVGRFIAENGQVSEVTNLAVVGQDGTSDYSVWALFAILVVVALLSLITIFQYKKRMRQIRLAIFSTVMLIGYYCVLTVFLVKYNFLGLSLSWTVCLPFVSMVLNWLAIRAIGKDEMLVKAYERLR